MRPEFAVGDTVKVLCDSTDGITEVREVVLDKVRQLGCGCLRLGTVRPGPQVEQYPQRMEFLTGCGMHDKFAS
jgi:hypothetical protein